MRPYPRGLESCFRLSLIVTILVDCDSLDNKLSVLGPQIPYNLKFDLLSDNLTVKNKFSAAKFIISTLKWHRKRSYLFETLPFMVVDLSEQPSLVSAGSLKSG